RRGPRRAHVPREPAWSAALPCEAPRARRGGAGAQAAARGRACAGGLLPGGAPRRLSRCSRMARVELGRRAAPHRPVRRVPPILLALPALAVARALPAEGAGLYLRLAAATAVVVVPGALAARALSLRGAAPALAFSLGALSLSLAVTFLVHGSLWLTLVGLGVVALAALVPAVRVETRRPGAVWLAVLLVGAPFGVA